MTVRERVLASRLIQKIDNQSDYAKHIGIGYTIVSAHPSNVKQTKQAVETEKKN